MIRATFVDEPPITEAEARAALRIRHTAEAGVLADKLRFATEVVEGRTTRLLRRHTMELTLAAWPCETEDSIKLPVYPVREVVSVEYRDAAGAWIEVPGGKFDWQFTNEGADVYFFSSYTLPALESEHRDRVRVTFEAGYETGEETGSSDDPALLLPAQARELVLLLAGHMFENREATSSAEVYVVPFALDMNLQDLRIFR